MRFEDLTGRKFGRLLVVERTSGASPKHTYWKCRCDCGNVTVTASQKLKSGRSKSCGCYNRDTTTKHGQSGGRLYKIWLNMKSRCFNPNTKMFNRYGGRGITMCCEWKNNFQAFYDWAVSNGYADNLTIDRIDVNGNYCPENCRWATMKEQGNNTTKNHIIEFNGETHTLSEWAELLGIHAHTLSNRIHRGWAIEKALSKKVIHR